jgi:adenosine deaminase CECR1
MAATQDFKQLLNEQANAAERSTTYKDSRARLLQTESREAWDAEAKARASDVEKQAQNVLWKIREHERYSQEAPYLFGNQPGEAIPDPHTRDMGGRFLPSKDRIERSKVFEIARQVPKGCHLHIHFNSELPPEVLLPHAKKDSVRETMCVRTDRPLFTAIDFRLAEVIFEIKPKGQPKTSCFTANYKANKSKGLDNESWMLWSDFRKQFPRYLKFEERPAGLDDAECWVREKMIMTSNDVYNDRQTVNGAWACFNQGTRAFKGLVNYESVYRWYIGAAIDSMIRDKVMYAELRPMLMDKTIPTDNGEGTLNHKAQMKIICEEVDKKKAQLKAENALHKFPFGLKIIYCAPRSIPYRGDKFPNMQIELGDCIDLKLAYPDLICGFDLVGAEDRPNSIGFYADLLLGFVETCKKLNISIPFMFHAGETLLDTGGSSDPDKSNLYDALLLNSRRIGHGYALLKHPLLIEKYKQQNISLELCPISNEFLHLCGNARQHPFPALLAAGLHCSLNADNPGLYR